MLVGRLGRRLGNDDHRRAQQAVGQQIALLHHVDDRIRRHIGVFQHGHGFVMLGVEGFADRVDLLDGHLVQGHVDGVANVISCERAQESVIIWLHCPIELIRYIAVKGSVTLAGVSLTVNEVEGSRFRVNVVPYTADETLLGRLRSGMQVNLEVDVLARYVERLLHPESGLTFSRLSELGYGRSHARGGSK